MPDGQQPNTLPLTTPATPRPLTIQDMRSALTFGINDYPGTGSDLAGCVNDASDWRALLENRGFTVTELLDAAATRSEMLRAMSALVATTKAGDTAVITYSGHGTWAPDDDGDEPDQRDEALCPHDVTTAGPLLDDDLFLIFAERHPRARLIFLSDSCHSGSVARMAPSSETQDHGRARFLPPAVYLSEAAAKRARKVEKAPPRGLSRGTALLLSGCADTEFSWDTTFGETRRPNGAFTRAAIDTLAKLGTSATYAQWHKAIRTRLPSASCPQTPQAMGSRHQRAWTALN